MRQIEIVLPSNKFYVIIVSLRLFLEILISVFMAIFS